MSKKSALYEYVLGFFTKEAPDTRQYWRCQAEDYDHAAEQLRDAEPTVDFHELFKTSKPDAGQW
jgi:hypothetical protein